MKTILITGSTDGIGKLVAMKLAKNGHQVILHGRNSEKLKNTILEIIENTKNKNVSGYISDMSNLDSIKEMITEISKKNSSIDVLINNAGVFKSTIKQNKEGLDLRFVVNYFAPYILTYGLLKILKNSTSPRIINLSSAAQATVSIEALKGNEPISNNNAYAQSKLALTMWSFSFAKDNPTITTLAVNPGSLLNTNMANEAYGQYWSPATKGSDILYDLAILENYKNKTGKYFDNDKGVFSNAHSDASDQEKIDLLIFETKKILKNEK